MALSKGLKKKPKFIEKVEEEKPVNKSQDISCMCGHAYEKHYGGSRGHCNISGCSCMEFR